MNILLLGSGGREHAFAWKMTQSSMINQLFVAPGNAGTASIATNLVINILDFEAVKSAVLEHNIQMVVVGPEDPLVAGIFDFFKQDIALQKIPVIGPSKKGAQLEGSKDFAKKFLIKNNIPTAAYDTFTPETLSEGFAFLEKLSPPYVLKADGLAAGKGVLIINDLEAAKLELSAMLMQKKFGNASAKVVIEEFLDGIELSCFVLTDGKDYKILPTAKDYKRIGEGDKGLNTGGMGAISPVPFADDEFMNLIENKIVKPTIEGLKADSIDYIGFIFIGLIKVKNQPYVIEYNVRMGDPETEVVLPRIENDLVALFDAVAQQNLAIIELKINPQTAATVMLVSGGYPEDYEKNKTILGLNKVEDSLVFHAGTKLENQEVLTNGGRVLAITSFGDDIEIATKKSYQNIDKICFDKMYFRKDIGFDLV
jgi:phosphoribosylamine--glycine ligase